MGMGVAGWLERGRTELLNLLRPNASDRPWELALCAALASGLPLLVAAYLGQLSQGLVASLGGMVFLYCPNTPVHHRAVTLMACAFGLMASYVLGLLGHLLPWLLVPLLTLSCMLVTMVIRFFALGPPGSLFFVMATAIAAYTPTPPDLLLERVGLIALGCLQAVLIAFLYSLYIVRRRTPKPAPSLPAPSFEFIVLDSVVMALFVGGSLLLAQLLQLDRPYWAPISCMAVIQGQSLRAVWTRQAHRITGTAVGLLVAGALLALPLGAWGVACAMTALAFVIELLVVRHYGLAVVFITPLTLLLAEAAQLGQVPIADLLEARLVDTVLGSLTGLVGGFCLHHPEFRRVLGGWLRRWVPMRERSTPAD